MPFVKRHRAGKELPEVVHPGPDPRAAALAEDLAQQPAVQAVILGGSRYTGGWDEQSDLDLVVILEDSVDEEESRKHVAKALIGLKERYYPGYTDWQHPDHGVEHGEWPVSMEYYLRHRRTVNHPMAQAARQGRIIPREPGTEDRYRHDGDTSNEWDLVTLPKLKRAATENRVTADLKELFNRNLHSTLNVYSIQGRNAYWLLWSSGSAIMSLLGIMHPNRSLVAMAETLRERDPGWNHRFASDLDCLDQYNYCACEVVVTEPIADLQVMWEALERDRNALWRRIEELSGYDLHAAPDLDP